MTSRYRISRYGGGPCLPSYSSDRRRAFGDRVRLAWTRLSKGRGWLCLLLQFGVLAAMVLRFVRILGDRRIHVGMKNGVAGGIRREDGDDGLASLEFLSVRFRWG